MSSKPQSEARVVLDQHLAKEISANMGDKYVAAKGALDRHVETAAPLPPEEYKPIEQRLDIRLGFELGL